MYFGGLAPSAETTNWAGSDGRSISFPLSTTRFRLGLLMPLARRQATLRLFLVPGPGRLPVGTSRVLRRSENGVSPRYLFSTARTRSPFLFSGRSLVSGPRIFDGWRIAASHEAFHVRSFGGTGSQQFGTPEVRPLDRAGHLPVLRTASPGPPVLHDPSGIGTPSGISYGIPAIQVDPGHRVRQLAPGGLSAGLQARVLSRSPVRRNVPRILSP